MSLFAQTAKGLVYNDRAKLLTEKWTKTPLLDKKFNFSEKEKSCLSQLLENQAVEVGKAELLTENFTTANIATINTIAFPVVVKAWKRLIAKDIVSVQPMSMPTGYVFYLDYLYSNSKGRYTADESILGAPVGSDISANGATTGLTERYYNLANSYGDFLASQSTLIVGESGSATWDEVGFNPALSGSTVYWGAIPTASFTASDCSGQFNSDRLVQVDVKSGSAVQYHIYNKLSGSYLKFYSNTNIGTGTFVTASWVCSSKIACSNGLEGYTITNESNLDNSNPTPTIPKVTLKVQKTSIVANEKKMQALWTNEAEQDMQAYLGYNAEQMMTNLLSDLLAFEIDQEVIEHLRTMAKLTKFVWSARPGERIQNHSDGTSITSVGYDSTMEWNQTLYITINTASATIKKKTRRVGANFIVTSPEVVALMRTTPAFVAAPNYAEETDTFEIGAVKAGTVQGRYVVYEDPTFPQNELLIGYNGKNPVDAGFVWAPYVPAMITETIRRFNDFNPTKGILSRNAYAKIRPDYYSSVYIKNFNISV